MAITPEFGEEELMHEQEEEVERQSGSQLPPWEDIGEAEVVEHELGDLDTRHRYPSNGKSTSISAGEAAEAGEQDDFDDSPDGWALELAGHVDEDTKPDAPPS